MSDKDKSYHLLISDGGKELICIVESEKNSNFTNEQRIYLERLYDDFIVVWIHPASIECYTRLDVISDIDKFISSKQ